MKISDEILIASALVTSMAEVGVAIFLAPDLLRWRREQKDREAKIRINLEVIDLKNHTNSVFGLKNQIASIQDITDHINSPSNSSKLPAGNEILLVGPAQSGKKALAFSIAKQAQIDTLVIVHNPRDADTLARATQSFQTKTSLWKSGARATTSRNSSQTKKIMLLLPGLDHVNGHAGEAWLDQLEGLIEMAATLPNVLIVGTTKTYDRNGEVSNWFGTVLPLPQKGSETWNEMMREVASGYLELAENNGFKLGEIKRDEFIEKVLEKADNSAEVQDILYHCQSMALHDNLSSRGETPLTAWDVLNKAIDRVIPPFPATQANVHSLEQLTN